MATNTLYVTEPGTSVHKADERLVLKRQNRVVGEVPLINLQQVVVVGRGVDFSTEALLILADRNIDLCFFSRSLQLKARVSGAISPHSHLRFLHARLVDDPARRLNLARVFVAGKLHNQRQALPARASAFERRIGQLIARLDTAHDLEMLRGFEGQGATLYFEGLREAYPFLREYGFTRRDYFPPPDPVNAILSFGYSLLTRETLAAVQLVGFDPYLGFFHAINYGRPSLALDLMEEFRPIVADRLTLGLLEQKAIGLADFERMTTTEPADEPAGEKADRPKYSWRLKPAARNRFLEAYEQQMAGYVNYPPEHRNHTLRRVIELQVRQLAALIRGEISQYRPYSLAVAQKSKG
jgi:CRISPR-associated protein Cas1